MTPEELPSAGEATKLCGPCAENGANHVGASGNRCCALCGWHGMDTPRNQSHSRFSNERPGQVGGYWSRGGRGGLGVFCLGRPTSPKGYDRIKLKGRRSHSAWLLLGMPRPPLRRIAADWFTKLRRRTLGVNACFSVASSTYAPSRYWRIRPRRKERIGSDQTPRSIGSKRQPSGCGHLEWERVAPWRNASSCSWCSSLRTRSIRSHNFSMERTPYCLDQLNLHFGGRRLLRFPSTDVGGTRSPHGTHTVGGSVLGGYGQGGALPQGQIRVATASTCPQ